jgi:hypothetical protein
MRMRVLTTNGGWVMAEDRADWEELVLHIPGYRTTDFRWSDSRGRRGTIGRAGSGADQTLAEFDAQLLAEGWRSDSTACTLGPGGSEVRYKRLKP